MSIESNLKNTVVIGGGIVGICCALYLQKKGFKVTVVDPSEAGESTAKWSCGQMAVSEIIPLSKKGILMKIPGWLLDQQGPLALRPSAFPSIIPWFLRFLNCARESRINEIASSLASLTQHVYEDYAVLLEDCPDKDLIGTRPILELFDSADDIEHEKKYLELRQSFGFKHQILNEKEISDLEPVFTGKFKHGLLFNDWTAVKDTKGFIAALTESFIAKGGERIRAEVVELREENNRLHQVLLSNHQIIDVDYAVVAAGVGSQLFSKQLGIDPPLAGIAGYQVVLPKPEVDIKHSTIYASGGFCFAPMSRGLQIGGTIEFAAAGAKPNMKRAEIILDKAKKVLPQLNTEGMEFGVGYRPFLPDTKPIIDMSSRLPNVALAFGHGQLGLTLGATTGRLVTEMLCQQPTKVDLTPFKANRF
ncbi:D-amino-acid dehydrogenase [Acinetobacter pittii]|uniref:D-amino-acid dehydrogenase n=1 Tax=Acinetobacter pittii TaxID=48296 RepID=A0A4Y3J7F0_ACIPI|nr:FAD-binding oxidoreductase [Acinetobacter pittii]GEA67376.1 D-amino-acid dehydrogenase [Acinetobacter pittii]